jgi:hypothetical protein
LPGVTIEKLTGGRVDQDHTEKLAEALRGSSGEKGALLQDL